MFGLRAFHDAEAYDPHESTRAPFAASIDIDIAAARASSSVNGDEAGAGWRCNEDKSKRA
jgi:hypothetical protein